MKNKEKMKKKEKITIIIIFCFAIVFSCFMIWAIISMKNSSQETYDFYKEWCPKLNATTVEPVEGYVHKAKCFRVVDREVKYYYITKVNDKNLLQEITYG